jgi:hypothetical protein
VGKLMNDLKKLIQATKKLLRKIPKSQSDYRYDLKIEIAAMKEYEKESRPK